MDELLHRYRKKIEYLTGNYSFIFMELVKRDFKKKYKRTVLGMFWSVLSPLLMLGVLAVIFGNFFGKDIPHFLIYVFSGQLVFNYFVEATNEGMGALLYNASIFTKVNVPKCLFVFSKNISALINFFIILCIYFLAVLLDGINFSWKFVFLIYPVACLIIFNIGMSFLLSAFYVMFRDLEYIYRIFTQLVMYGSAIFYSIEIVPDFAKGIFYCNPIFLCITYIRSIVLNDTIPDGYLHGGLAMYAVGLFAVGILIYKKYNYKFLYYV